MEFYYEERNGRIWTYMANEVVVKGGRLLRMTEVVEQEVLTDREGGNDRILRKKVFLYTEL